MILSDDEVKARNCLREGSYLIDPKHQFPPDVFEEKLKAKCRACWAMREWWPSWVKVYAAKWAKEKGDAAN